MAEPTGASPPPVPTPGPSGNWAKTTLWGVVLLFLALNLLLFLKTCRDMPGRTLEQTGRVIDKAGAALSSIAAAFRQGTITTSFVSYATSLTNHQRLQVATLREMAVFTQTNQMSTAFGYLPLPDVVVEARAPVEYTYYVDLNDPWRFVLENGVVVVQAPRLQFNKPAVDVSGLSYEVRKGSFKTDEALAGLKQSITSLVVVRGRENAGLVRESARREVAGFVEKWLQRSFRDAPSHSVKVIFAGEPGAAPAGPVLPAPPR